MENQIFLQGTTPSQLVELINEGVKNQLEQFKEEFKASNDGERLLTTEEVCELLQINPSTLWRWQKRGEIQSYGIVNRRYYKYHEIMESLTPLKTAS